MNVLDEVFDYAKRSGSQILIHNGDLFETLKDEINKTLYLTVFAKFVEFSKEGIIVILNVGNHDQIGKFGEENILKPFKEIDNVLVMDTPQIQELDGFDLALVPYTIRDFRAMVRDLVRNKKQAYLFTHQGINGAKVGPRDERLRDEYTFNDFSPNSWNIIFNGHYHKKQTIGNKLQVIGSPLQRDFGERNDDKGFLCLDTETNNLDYIKTNGPRFYKVEGKELKIPEGFREDIDFLWYKGEKSPGAVPANIQNIRVDVEKSEQYQIRSEINISFPIEEQMGRYISFIEPKDLDVDKLIEIGVRCWRESL